MSHYLPNIKRLNICVLGEVGVGKSSLIIKFVQSHFTEDHDPTLQETYSRSIRLAHSDESLNEANSFTAVDNTDENAYLLDILDTVGIEDYSESRENEIQEADAIIFCYDVTSKQSFDIVTVLHQQVLRCREDDSLPPMILSGNRSDLVDSRQLSYEDGQILAKELNLNFFIETSAKLNVNVEEVFTKTAQEVIKVKEANQQLLNNSQPETAPIEGHNHPGQENDPITGADSINNGLSQNNATSPAVDSPSQTRALQSSTVLGAQDRGINPPKKTGNSQCCIIM